MFMMKIFSLIQIHSLPLDNIYSELYFKDFSLIEYEQITWSKMVEFQ